MTEKQLYQLSLLYQMIQSTSCGKLSSFMSVDPTCLSALKHIVSETHGLSGQQSRFLNVKASQLLKVVRHVKQNFQDVRLKIDENFNSTNILIEKQKKMMELKQKKIKNICGQLLIEKLNKEKNNNVVQQEQMQRETQQVGQQYSIQQPNQSKVSKASTGNRQLKKMKFEQVNIKQNNKNSSKVSKGNEGQNQNRKKEPIKINLIQQKKGKNRAMDENQKMFSNSNNQNHSNQENMMNSSNLVTANLFKRQKVHNILSHANMDLSQLSRPQYRKTQNFRQKQFQYQDMPSDHIHTTNQNHNEHHKKVLLKKHNHHDSQKIQMKKNSKLGDKKHSSKDNKQNRQRQRQRQKSPLIKRIMKTQYEQAQIYDDNQVSQNQNQKNQKQVTKNYNYHEKRKYNDYFASTTAATDDQDEMLSSNVNSKINNRNNIRKTQRIISNQKNQRKKLNQLILMKEENNFNHNHNLDKDKNKSNCEEYQHQHQHQHQHQRSKSPKFQGRKTNKKITLSKNCNSNNQSMSNLQNQNNQTFKTDELFDSQINITEKVQNSKKERKSLQSGYSSESQILRLQAQFQKDIQQINNKNREEQNQKQKKQSHMKGNSKKYPQNNYEKVVQEEPWECDELQLQEELKAIDQKLSHRASKSPLSKRGIQTLSHLELKSALHEANQFQNYHQNEPKIVRLSLTPKGCKDLLIKKSKVSMKPTNSRSNLKSRSKSPQFQKSKSQDKLKTNFNKMTHINPISKVSKFDQDFAFPISIEVQVNKNAHKIGKWNKKLISNNFCSNQQSHMRHPKRKQLLSDQIESINKFY